MIHRRTPAEVVRGEGGASEYPEVRPGDRVRSYDFKFLPGALVEDSVEINETYVEGVVEDVREFPEFGFTGCDYAMIRTERRVVAGEEQDEFSEHYWAPVNGVPVAGFRAQRTQGIVVLKPNRQSSS